MLKTKVIASSITNLTDARYFAARECEWIGFCLDKNSENYIKPEAVVAIKEWVDGVKFIGEFPGASAEEIIQGAEVLKLDAVQINDLAGIDVLMQLEDLTVFKEIAVDSNTDSQYLENLITQFSPYCKNFILKLENKNLLNFKFSEDINIWCDADIKADQLQAIIDSYPVGIVLRGGAEEKVGFKSFDELDEILDELEILV